LRSELDRLAPTPARDRAFAMLDTLESARDRVSAAAGSAELLDAAIAALEDTFVGLTGQDSTRGHGQAYAGRTLVGEDCVRGVDVDVGPPLIERIAGPLQLVLDSARWYTYEIARRFRAKLVELYRGLRGNSSVVEYARINAQLPELLPAGSDSIVAQVTRELHARWREVLGIEGGERKIERSVETLRPLVASAFAAPGPGWPSARYHSPDILLAGAGIDAINRGDFIAVLGEIHVGMNTRLEPYSPNTDNHDPDAPFARRDLDLAPPLVAPVWSRGRSRIDHYSRSLRDYDVELADARSRRPDAHRLAISELVVEEIEGQLVVRTRDHRIAFDIIAFLEHYLVGASFSEFGLLSGDHTPRVVVDGVVLSRERWVTAAAELAFAHAPDAFVAVRAWARALGLPRRLFIKVPEETKPLFVDLASPILVEIAARLVRQASKATISEMVPDLDELWLEDAEGRHYTCELRIAAVDGQLWHGAYDPPKPLDGKA
jgi:Lantibiotic dehydratase, N terminus